eukprot:scaffold7729_cov82-Skeletonema_marinoi.AAC.1
MLSPASTNFDAMSTERSIINFTLVAGSNASTGANGATARAVSLFAGIINAAVDADIICWSTFLRFDDGGGAKAITSSTFANGSFDRSFKVECDAPVRITPTPRHVAVPFISPHYISTELWANSSSASISLAVVAAFPPPSLAEPAGKARAPTVVSPKIAWILDDLESGLIMPQHAASRGAKVHESIPHGLGPAASCLPWTGTVFVIIIVVT